jgi:RimJ/RimL family protein N-acetyltransferase
VAHNTPSWEGLRLYTDRLRLRTPTPRDADALYDLFKDPDVMHGLGKEPVSAPEQARAIIEEWIAAWRTDALGPLIIETAATNRRVFGQAGLMIFDTRGWTPSTWANAGSHAQPELGWALMRAHWGHGYATEAAAAIREWAHESRSIEQLVSLISSDNVRSQRVAERLGAIPTETVIPVDSGRKTVVWNIRFPPDPDDRDSSRQCSRRDGSSSRAARLRALDGVLGGHSRTLAQASLFCPVDPRY